MAAPSYTYTLTNGTTADASQVMQDFNDILNGVTDGTKDLSINALTCAGTTTLNGNVILGNASGDDVTMTGSLATSIPIKTDNSFDIGATSLRIRRAYLAAIKGGSGAAGASSGDLWEYQTQSVLSSAPTSMSTGTVVSIASIAITAGEWIIGGVGGFSPGATTSITLYEAAITTSNGGTPSGDARGVPDANGQIVVRTNQAANVMGGDFTITIPTYRVLTSSSRDYYLTLKANFTVSTLAGFGCLFACRVR